MEVGGGLLGVNEVVHPVQVLLYLLEDGVSEVGGIGELEEGHHMLLHLTRTLLLGNDLLQLQIEVCAGLVDLLKDEHLLVRNHIAAFAIERLGL